MADDQPLIVVDAAGKEWPFPPSFDPKEAARLVREGKAPEPHRTSLPEPKPWDIPELAGGVAENFNPMNYYRALKYLFSTDPRVSLPQMKEGIVQQVKDFAHGDARAAGQIGGGFLLGEGVGLVGKGLQRVAPGVMDLGLARTAAQKLEFPGASTRLIEEGIVPKGSAIQDALTATEEAVDRSAKGFDMDHQIYRVDPDALARSAQDFALKEGKVEALGNVPGPEVAELDALAQKYLGENTRTRSLGETIDQKRAFAARTRYSNRPNAPTVTNEASNFNKGIARANRAKAIELDPALEAMLAKEQDLMGALTAQKLRDVQSAPVTSVGALRSAIGLRNPTVMGNAAIAADRTGQALQRAATPAQVAAALRALMASHDMEPKP